jgi:hypothetical protein
VGFIARHSGVYQLAGQFARVDPIQGEGDGVTVAVVRSSPASSIVYSAVIPSSVLVRLDDVFSAGNSASFALDLDLRKGEVIRLVVLNGPPDRHSWQGDVTAVRFSVRAQFPLPRIVAVRSEGNAFGFEWEARPGETYDVNRTGSRMDGWSVVATVRAGMAGTASWRTAITETVGYFRVSLRSSASWVMSDLWFSE